MGTRYNRLSKPVLTSTHNLCFEQEYEKYQNFFYQKSFILLGVKFSVYLNRHVFVMGQSEHYWIDVFRGYGGEGQGRRGGAYNICT